MEREQKLRIGALKESEGFGRCDFEMEKELREWKRIEAKELRDGCCWRWRHLEGGVWSQKLQGRSRFF